MSASKMTNAMRWRLEQPHFQEGWGAAATVTTATAEGSPPLHQSQTFSGVLDSCFSSSSSESPFIAAVVG